MRALNRWGATVYLVGLCCSCAPTSDVRLESESSGDATTIRSGAADQGEFDKAIVLSYFNSRKAPDRTTIEISDRGRINTLAAFFPDMGQGKQSGISAAEDAFAKITFIRADGSNESVHVSYSLDAWSEGPGDWPLSADFPDYFLGLLREEEKKGQFVKAVVESHYNSRSEADDIKFEVSDPERIEALADFFPDMGEGRESDTAAGDESFADIRFIRTDGSTVTVDFSHSLDAWSEGEGDWPLSPEFRDYFLTLLREEEQSRRQPAQEEGGREGGEVEE